MNRSGLKRFAWISIAPQCSRLCSRGRRTGSRFGWVASDAIESVVNLIGGIMALSMLTVAARPADEDHAYGHSKAEYFSSGVEGGLIVMAAISIAVAAVPRLVTPKPLAEIGFGLAVSMPRL